MASIQSRFYYSLLRLINKKRFLEMQFTFGKFDFYQCSQPPRETFNICQVTTYEVKGRKVFQLAPKGKSPKKHVLYLHGGAYVQNCVKQHWRFFARLVEHTGCTITVPDYPLAPNHTFMDAFDMVIPLYKEFISKNDPSNSILMGDSAGGGFALALAQKMKLNLVPQPEKIILLSPWLDITLTNPEITKIDEQDPFLGVPGLRKAGLAYAGNSNPENFMLSPINGPLEGLGEIWIFIGGRDILAADTRKLCSLAHQKGILINYREYKDMVHGWVLLNFRESRHAQNEIMDLIKTE